MVNKFDFIAIHISPLWAEKADFKIFADISAGSEKKEWEQLWTKSVGEQMYEICCVPFFVDNLAIGDTVQVDDQLVIRSVIKRSGHSTFRIWFGDLPSDFASETGAKIFNLGFGVEWHSIKLLAVDCTGKKQFDILNSYLIELSETFPIKYEVASSP